MINKKDKITKQNIIKNKEVIFKEEDFPNAFVSISSFDFLISKERLKFFNENIKTLKEIINNYKLSILLNNNKLTLSTTKNTRDPYAFIMIKSYLFCLIRGASLKASSKLFNSENTYEIVDISLKKKDTFINRRNRLIRALKPIEKLSETNIFIYGKTCTIIGEYKNVRDCVKIVLSCLENKHPLYLLKELMAKRELEVRKELENVDWKELLPEVKKKIKSRKKE